MRVYVGAMHEQYAKALAAAGNDLRLGVVFANMVTVRLRKLLGVMQKGLVNRLSRKDRRDARSVKAERLRLRSRLANTSLSPFTDVWPEELCMRWLESKGVPTVVVTDDVHYQRAPQVLEEAGLCDLASSCPAIGKWMERRELALYGLARTIFTVSTEDSQMIENKLALRENRCGSPNFVWVPYVDTVVDKEALVPFAARQDGLVYLGGRHAIAEKGVGWLLSEVQPHAKLLGAQLIEHGRGHLVLIGPGWDDNLVHSSVEGLLGAAKRQGRITVLGMISDAELYQNMQRYRVLAAPAFNMTGVATKNIHALASGLPLVTTSEGLRGLNLPDGQDVVFVRDNATEFAQTVMLIQRNFTMFSVAQARGLAHARRMFTLSVQADVLCKALRCEGVPTAMRDAWSAWNAVRQHLVAS